MTNKITEKTNSYISKTEKYSAHNYAPIPLVIERGEGVWVYDVDENKYLDMLSAYSALNHGHLHPKIVKAMNEQLKTLSLTSRAFYSAEFAEFSQFICDFTGYDMVLPMNSGAEAVETAVKIARKWAYKVKGVEKNKAEIIVCKNNFHGRTISIISFSSEEAYKEDFGPFTPGFKIVPYGDIEALKNAINKNTAAFIVEPIQGEGGVLIPPAGYLKEVEKICKSENILFVTDEIQTGLGRTGKLFCYNWESVNPDLLIVGKALGGGIMPISGVLGNKNTMELLQPGEHGSTFGGNPLASRVAIEAMKVLKEENLIEKSRELGEFAKNYINTKINSQYIKEVRGKGLFIGIELKDQAGGARRFTEKLAEMGVLCKETHENVIRIAPPLVITKEELLWGLEKIKTVLETL